MSKDKAPEGQKKPYAYAAIDLKSFYASVECIDRDLDPLTTNLVVADASRTDKTICLAVSPSLKSYGTPGRPRLFEVVQKVREINALRRYQAPEHKLEGESFKHEELEARPQLAVGYITAVPRMALYMQYSTKIYNIYLQYIAPEDIKAYSIDEVFIDLTKYLPLYKLTATQLVRKLMGEVLKATGITATAGLGTNLYLAKIAMDITAKHAQPDEYGARLAELDELSYRRKLWAHRPLTDFWRVGPGYARKLEAHGLYTMGDVARCSMGGAQDFHNEDLLYKLFGKNAELLIDHAWGWEPCTMEAVQAYKPETKSLGAGQVLMSPYPHDKARLIVHEMTEQLALDLVSKHLVTDRLVLTLGYDCENMRNEAIRSRYSGEVKLDSYGREVPKHAHGTANLGELTASAQKLSKAMLALFDRITDPLLLVRRVTLSANRVVPEGEAAKRAEAEEIDLFADAEAREREAAAKAKEQRLQQTVLGLQAKFGKNAVLKGMNLLEGATTIQRNGQIGGHKA